MDKSASLVSTFNFKGAMRRYVRRSRPRMVLGIKSVKVDPLSEMGLFTGSPKPVMIYRHEFSESERKEIVPGSKIVYKMDFAEDKIDVSVTIQQPSASVLSRRGGQTVNVLLGQDVYITEGEDCDVPVMCDDGEVRVLNIRGNAILKLLGD